MPRRIVLFAGILLATATSVYAVRPTANPLNAFEVDMEAADLCHGLATDAVRGKSVLQVVREKVKTSRSREAERTVGLVVQTADGGGDRQDFRVTCLATWTESGMMLIDLDVDQLPVFHRGVKLDAVR